MHFSVVRRNLQSLRKNEAENTYRSIDWLIDWFIDPLIDWLIDWLVDWFIDRLTDWLIDWLIYRSIDWLIDWLISTERNIWGNGRQKTSSCILLLKQVFTLRSFMIAERRVVSMSWLMLALCSGTIFASDFSARKTVVTGSVLPSCFPLSFLKSSSDMDSRKRGTTCCNKRGPGLKPTKKLTTS